MNPTRSTPNHTPARRPVLAAVAACLLLAGQAAWAADGVADGAAGSADGGADSAESAGGDAVLEWLQAEDLLPLLETHRGKAVLVNFWATWCGPCIHEIPALINLKEKLDPARFALVAISLDDRADAPWLVPEFIETRFPEWHSYLNAEFEDYPLVEELDPDWSGMLPSNYVIGPDGAVARKLLGGHSEEQFEEAVRAAMPDPAMTGETDP